MFFIDILFNFSFQIEAETAKSVSPDKPSFSLQIIDASKGIVRVYWKPSEDGNPGNEFYVKYCISNTEECETTTKITDNNVIVYLKPNEKYDVSVVSVDGNEETESDVQQYPKASKGNKSMVLD